MHIHTYTNTQRQACCVFVYKLSCVYVCICMPMYHLLRRVSFRNYCVQKETIGSLKFHIGENRNFASKTDIWNKLKHNSGLYGRENWTTPFKVKAESIRYYPHFFLLNPMSYGNYTNGARDLRFNHDVVISRHSKEVISICNLFRMDANKCVFFRLNRLDWTDLSQVRSIHTECHRI